MYVCIYVYSVARARGLPPRSEHNDGLVFFDWAAQRRAALIPLRLNIVAELIASPRDRDGSAVHLTTRSHHLRAKTTITRAAIKRPTVAVDAAAHEQHARGR